MNGCIAVCVSTCKRPAGLERLLNGLDKLRFRKVPEPRVEIIVVDNDREHSAEMVCRDARQCIRWDITYSVEDRRGIPFARNRSVLLADQRGAEAIAFIDDDEVPDPSWLDELLDAARTYDADAVAGPVISLFEDCTPAWVKSGKFFAKIEKCSGTPLMDFATSSLLIRTDTLTAVEPVFDERLAMTGGSDTHLSIRLAKLGCRMIWCEEALVYETVPTTRTTVRWLLARAYRDGNNLGFYTVDLDSSLHSVALRIGKAFARIAQGILVLPFAICWGRAHVVRSLRHLLRGIGMIVGMTGQGYDEYARIHGN